MRWAIIGLVVALSLAAQEARAERLREWLNVKAFDATTRKQIKDVKVYLYTEADQDGLRDIQLEQPCAPNAYGGAQYQCHGGERNASGYVGTCIDERLILSVANLFCLNSWSGVQGLTPFRVRMLEGTYFYHAKKKGYYDSKGKVIVQANGRGIALSVPLKSIDRMSRFDR